MNTLLVNTKDEQELQLVQDLLSKMKIKTRILSSEEKEDIGLLGLMKEADRTKKVTRATIMKKLNK